MKYFTNLSTRAKLLFSFGLVLLMFLVVIIIAYRGLQDITQSEKELYTVHFRIALELRQLRSHQNFNRAAILDMMLTQNNSEQIEIESTIKDKAKEISDIIENLSNFNMNVQFQKQLKELKDNVEKYRETREEEIKLIQAGKLIEAQIIGETSQKELFEKIRTISTKMGDDAEKAANDQLTLDQLQADSSMLLFSIFGIAALLFSILMVVLMNRTIAVPLIRITEIASNIAEGDLNIELSVVERKDEVGVLTQTFSKMIGALKVMATAAQKIASGDLTGSIVPQSEKDILGNAFSQMLNNLRRIMNDILESTNQLASSSSEILAATTQVASGSTETASAISETTTTVEEVRQASQLTSEKAGRVAESAQRVAQVVQDGQKSVEETSVGMELISTQMESIADTIINLSEQSQSIGGIIALVNDVADQSNLLAVNAGIEAVKAGEQGKGFGVVAQEIKSLAEQSKNATIQVREILTDIQKTTSAAVMVIEKGTKAVEAGLKQASKSGEAIQVLANTSKEAVQAATQIVSSNQQQKVGMDQIGSAMENINQASAENSASMRQAEVAAKNLNELGQKLKKLVDQYKL